MATMTVTRMHSPNLVQAASYSKDFFDNIEPGSTSSAAIVVPIVLEIVRPQSVVDVGCGSGCWLKEFRRCGIQNLNGIDGSWVTKDSFGLEWDAFHSHDLEKPLPAIPCADLAISLEVAEHLPEAAASSFIESLTALSDVVLFSAAVPGQGGTRHLNEQWPEYWSTLFETRGYQAFDVIRPQIWNKEEVEVWYRQNCLLFVNRQAESLVDRLNEIERKIARPLSLIHPSLFAASRKGAAAEPSFMGTMHQLPILFARAIQRRISR